MRDHRRRRLQFRSKRPANLTFDPWRPDGSAWFIFQRIRKINDIASGLSRTLPVSSGRFRITGKKSKIDIVELLRSNALNERDLILHRLQLPQRLVVIQQLYV